MALPNEQVIEVEIAYALPQHQFLKRIIVPRGITAEQAILLSGIGELFPILDLAKQKIGIFGKLTTLDAVLQSNDRIEIYRSLQHDPKENRRMRHKKKLVR